MVSATDGHEYGIGSPLIGEIYVARGGLAQGYLILTWRVDGNKSNVD
jgi:hypothetical protein